MPQISRSAPIDEQVRAIIRKVLNGRSGTSVDPATKLAVREMIDALLQDAHATGFKEARQSCTLCAIVRPSNRSQQLEEDEDQ